MRFLREYLWFFIYNYKQYLDYFIISLNCCFFIIISIIKDIGYVYDIKTTKKYIFTVIYICIMIIFTWKLVFWWNRISCSRRVWPRCSCFRVLLRSWYRIHRNGNFSSSFCRYFFFVRLVFWILFGIVILINGAALLVFGEKNNRKNRRLGSLNGVYFLGFEGRRMGFCGLCGRSFGGFWIGNFRCFFWGFGWFLAVFFEVFIFFFLLVFFGDCGFEGVVVVIVIVVAVIVVMVAGLIVGGRGGLGCLGGGFRSIFWRDYGCLESFFG